MGQLTRRSFLNRTLASAGGAGVAASLSARAFSAVGGANGDVRVAMVGLGRRGPELVDWFRKVPGVRITALCDCDSQCFAKPLQKLAGAKEKPRTVVDFRRVLDGKDIDAVAIATPNHWHALMAIWACQAGKDVYVEKPVSHNVWEGRQIVAAARKYKRIVQGGTQNRSCTGLRAALAWLRPAPLGKLKLVRCFDFPRRTGIGKVTGPQPVPATVDYNLFQGPAPLTPPRRKEFHYDWHWFWDVGDGDCGNRGVHTFDHVRWFMGETAETLPPSVISIGGRMGWDDDGQTPNTQITLFDCKPVPILWEMMTLEKRLRAAHLDRVKGLWGSMIFEYEGGYFGGNRGGGRAFDKAGKQVKTFRGDSGVTHAANFIDAVRSRKTADQRAEIRQTHLSSAMCHVANVSYRVGHRRSGDEIRKAVAGSELLAESFDRLVRHLGINGVDPGKTPLTLGARLALDARTERFTGDGSRWANMYHRRIYRPPFVMPEKV